MVVGRVSVDSDGEEVLRRESVVDEVDDDDGDDDMEKEVATRRISLQEPEVSIQNTEENGVYIKMIGGGEPVPEIQRCFSPEDWVLLDAMGCSSLAGGCSGRFLTMHKRRRKKLMTRSLSQDVAILDDIHHGQVQYILDRCGLWGFNAFTLETVAGGRSLPVLCVHLFHWYGLLDHFRLDVVRVWKLFSLIEEGYHSTNPYHNSIHATDVTQAMHCFLQEEKIRRHVTPVEIMAALIGAVAHDLDHPGVNQHFLISTSNHLAILYENRSVLENHHWRSALGCLLESGVAEQVVEIREDLENQIRDLILATDINRQQEFLTKFRNHLDDDTLDLTIAENRQFILQIALKCADISNPTRPWDISHKWSLKVCDEFFRQGNYERELNLPITSICDQQSTTVAKIQSGFFKYVVTPLFCEWHRFLHSALSTHMTELLEANRQRWVDQERAELQQETVKEVTGIVHTEVVLSETDVDPDLREVTSEDEESRKGDLSSGAASIIMEFISPPHHPREMRRQSLAVPGLETLPGGLRRHSVPVNILEPDTAGNTSGITLPPTAMGHLPRTILRRESLPGRSTRGTSPTALGDSSRASSGLRTDDYDELMNCCYGGSQTSVSSGSGGVGQYGSTTMDEGNGERPLSAETLLPEHSIASMTSSVGVQAGRLSSVLQGTVLSSVQGPSTGGGTTKLLTRQQTFPPPQPYMRMRYMSATAEMSTCKETVHEVDDSRSNSSHGSHENISPKPKPPVLQHYAIPSIAVLSPSNGRAPEILLAETTAAKPPQSGNSSHKRESSHVDVSSHAGTAEKAPKMAKFSCDVGTSAAQSHQQKENVDPRRFASTSLTKRRGSAPLNLPLMLPDENAPPAGRSVYSTTAEMAHTLRRGSVPIEITRYRCEDSSSGGGAMLPPVDHPATTTSFHHPHNLWRYQSQQRRGSAPTTTTVTPTTAKELLLLTRHTSLNGNAGKQQQQQQQRRNGGSANNSGLLGKKQQLRRRSSGGPETVRLSEVTGFEGGSCSMLLRQMSPLTGSVSVTGIGGVASETLLARRRGSLPIEVLSVGNSVF